MELMTGIALASALSSAYMAKKKGDDQADAQKADGLANAIKTQFSPYTKANISNNAPTKVGPSVVGNAMQGGLAGAKLGMDFQKFQDERPQNVVNNNMAMNTATPQPSISPYKQQTLTPFDTQHKLA